MFLFLYFKQNLFKNERAPWRVFFHLNMHWKRIHDIVCVFLSILCSF